MLALGCAAPQHEWVAYAPLAAPAHPGRDKGATTQRAVIAITDSGGEIETADGAAGIVVSKWFYESGIGAAEGRFRVRVAVADDGAFEISVLCEEKPWHVRDWRRCEVAHPGQLPRDVVDRLATYAAQLR